MVVRLYRHLMYLIIVLSITAMGCASQSPDDDSNNKEKDVFALVAQADKAYVENRWLQAEQSYKAIIERVPHDHYAWFRLANTQLRQGRVQSSINAFEEAIKRDPKHPKTYYNLSIAYLLTALVAMEQADQTLRDHDPGKAWVKSRIKLLQDIVDEPIDSNSPGGARLKHFGSINH